MRATRGTQGRLNVPHTTSGLDQGRSLGLGWHTGPPLRSIRGSHFGRHIEGALKQ